MVVTRKHLFSSLVHSIKNSRFPELRAENMDCQRLWILYWILLFPRVHPLCSKTITDTSWIHNTTLSWLLFRCDYNFGFGNCRPLWHHHWACGSVILRRHVCQSPGCSPNRHGDQISEGYPIGLHIGRHGQLHSLVCRWHFGHAR